MLTQPTDSEVQLGNDSESNPPFLTPEQEKVLAEASQTIKVESSRTIDSILRIGAELWKVKETVPHGHFKAWVQHEFQWSYDHARNLMNIYYRFGHLGLDAGKVGETRPVEVSTTVLAALAAPSTSDLIRNDFIEALGEGHAPTPADIALAKAKEYVTLHGSPAIQQRVNEGSLAPLTAERLIRNLAHATPRISALVDRHSVSDPALIPILSRMEDRKSRSLNEIEVTGHLQGSEEPVPLSDANSRDLLDYLMEARWHHVQDSYTAIRELQLVVDDDKPAIEWDDPEDPENDQLVEVTVALTKDQLAWLNQYGEDYIERVRVIFTRMPMLDKE